MIRPDSGCVFVLDFFAFIGILPIFAVAKALCTRFHRVRNGTGVAGNNYSGSDGRAVRQRSAKPSTAVRFRFAPQQDLSGQCPERSFSFGNLRSKPVLYNIPKIRYPTHFPLPAADASYLSRIAESSPQSKRCFHKTTTVQSDCGRAGQERECLRSDGRPPRQSPHICRSRRQSILPPASTS